MVQVYNILGEMLPAAIYLVLPNDPSLQIHQCR